MDRNKRAKRRRGNNRLLILLLVLAVAGAVFAVVYNIIPHSSNDVREAVNIGEEQPIAAADENQPVKEAYSPSGKIIVLDAGHGMPSSQMSDAQKAEEGYQYSEVTETWGEWRHYKHGTFGEDCFAADCTLTAPPNGSCWYPNRNGDRDKEPEINLTNAYAAKQYLEAMGYEVRMTRETGEQNPSMNKRVSYCFPNNDIYQNPDAALYVCIHSNAGGGSGTSYISLGGEYTQGYIPADYVERSNSAGSYINSKVAAATGLSDNGAIQNEEYLILFNKAPVPIAYLEIGFYDNENDLEILNSSSDAIGQAIAEGVDEFLANNR